jgi:hypothetical protein
MRPRRETVAQRASASRRNGTATRRKRPKILRKLSTGVKLMSVSRTFVARGMK